MGFVGVASLRQMESFTSTIPTHGRPSGERRLMCRFSDAGNDEAGHTLRDRLRKECGPITDPQLYRRCLDSFVRY
jgi:hypothetical protein